MSAWPTRPDGTNKSVGEMTAAERADVFAASLGRIKAELESPAMKAALTEWFDKDEAAQ